MRTSALIAICLALSGAVAHAADAPQKGYRPRAPSFDANKRKLLEPKADFGVITAHFGRMSSYSSSGPIIKRMAIDEHDTPLRQLRTAAAQRLVELDPNHELLSKEEWASAGDLVHRDFHQMENEAEGLKFTLQDQRMNLRDVKLLEEKARGALARKLADALAHEAPSPEKLADVTKQLAAKHPMLASSFKTEMLIADMRQVVPALAKWDFREDDNGRRFRGTNHLPASTQATVEHIGHRAFEGVNVMFTNHMYADSLVMVDALKALGMEPENARFVATPYPFKDKVKKLIEHRGVKVDATAYDVPTTKKNVSAAIKDLVLRSNENHGPILVFDDGGMATEVIAKEYPHMMSRFRIVEITKAGERVAKSVLPEALGVNKANLGYVFGKNRTALRDKYIEIHNADEPSKKKAESFWGGVHERHNTLIQYNEPGVAHPPAFGFAYYTYSDTPYKRDVMTPLYTEQVNASLFNAIERGDGRSADAPKLVPKNKRVTIVGGGAMGIASGRELREKGYEVTFVDPDPARVKLLQSEGFPVEPLHQALPGRGIILEMAGIKKTIGLDEISLIDDGTFVAHGSSKDNPFDMDSIRAMANKKTDWPDHEGQRSASYTFKAAGVTKTLHFPGDGFTISHGGKVQNVPLAKFEPELDRLVNLGVYALENKPVTHFPMFSAPESAMNPSGALP